MKKPESNAARSLIVELTAILTALERGGINIPSNAKTAYRDFSLAGVPLRLYALTASLNASTQHPEWSLFLIVKSLATSNFPPEINLKVTNLANVLAHRFDQQANANYLFTRVIGTWNERFLVTIAFANTVSLTLPPFAFHED